MSYDLHVVRTEDWLDAEQKPILKPEVDALVNGDPSLEWSTEDWIELQESPHKPSVRYYMIRWNGEPSFLWCGGEISCASPSEEQTGKLVEIAQQLEAFVVGDDGEHYEPSTWRNTYRGE